MRAKASGFRLSANDAAIAKGMLKRGDRQLDIAAWFGVNGGRIAEIASGQSFPNVMAASADELPPKGPYLSGRETEIAAQALAAVKTELAKVEAILANKVPAKS